MDVKTFDDKCFRDMRNWLIDCYSDEKEEIMEASNETILKVIQRDYDGGILQFVKDSEEYVFQC